MNNVIEANNSGVACAGRVELFLSERPNLYEYYDFVFGFNMKSYVSQRTGVTACALFDRPHFTKAGGFDGVESGGDRMFFKRILDSEQIPYVYCPEFMVFHPCRASYKELVKKIERVGRGLVHYSRTNKNSRLDFVVKNVIGALVQVHQLKTILRKRKIVFQSSMLSGLSLIALIFWLGFYARIYIVIKSFQKF